MVKIGGRVEGRKGNMNHREYKSLKVGDRVFWNADENDDQGSPDKILGKVIEKGYAVVKIEWSDGVIGTVHPNDLRRISR